MIHKKKHFWGRGRGAYELPEENMIYVTFDSSLRSLCPVIFVVDFCKLVFSKKKEKANYHQLNLVMKKAVTTGNESSSKNNCDIRY